ncbi:unnamed protein product [Spodoptera littoralis]|uniref:Peptidase S1 domain-containing protein n=1 Tax=Spodoptera littoralis TaxID=7109 RepID=A0A9P0NAF3_SPOLI|nr:unnamed protein product [Spodoptera littoralis]CAH1647337.1 unnamed protein product [Spodoptera littoralis]
MIVPTLLVIATMLANYQATNETRRIFRGVEDFEGKYPYVVALYNDYRRCTGTLIDPNWVLTAAHCLTVSKYVQFGNMKTPFNETQSKRRILHMEQPTTAYAMIPDLGLVYIDVITMAEYGHVSAVDYEAIQGHAVEYAGYGFTQKDLTNDIAKVFQDDQIRPLQIGSGIVSKCENIGVSAPHICLAPKCSNKLQQTLPGDTGGPLFFNGKVAALHVGTQTLNSIRYYTPLSPYLTWIQKVIGDQHSHRKYSEVFNTSSAIQDKRDNFTLKSLKFHNISQYLIGLRNRVKHYRKLLSKLVKGFEL